MRDRSEIDAEDGEITELPQGRSRRSRDDTSRPHVDNHAGSAALLSRAVATSRQSTIKRDRHASGLNNRRSRSPRRRRRERDSPERGADVNSDVVVVENGSKGVEVETSTVNNGATHAADADNGFELSFERDDDAETERLLDERRRRRNEILRAHANTDAINSTAAAASFSTGKPQPASSSENSEFALAKKGDMNTADQGVSAADYDPNADIDADDMRHRIAAQVTNGDTKADARVATAVAAAATSNDDDDDGFDMFADDDEGIEAPAETGVSAAAAAMMADSWDDAE
ncbi:hypothetical protein H4R20_004336, partial [Coemansia guatemalensis]